MPSRRTNRVVDPDPGWVERRFRELENRLAALDGAKLDAVADSAVTVEQVFNGQANQFVNTDIVTASGAGDLTLVLSKVPIVESLHIRLDGSDQFIGVDFTYNVGTNSVTLADPDSLIEADQVMTAAYAYIGAGTFTPTAPELVLRGGTSIVLFDTAAANTVPLHGDTEVGDTIVAVMGNMQYTADPGSSDITDSRGDWVAGSTRMWVGTASDLSDLDIFNSINDRLTVVVATFAPVTVATQDTVGPIDGGMASSVACPEVAALAAFLGVSADCPSGSSTVDDVPAGYTEAILIDGADGAVCPAGIWYWSGTSSSPSGDIEFTVHSDGFLDATTVGLI